MEPKWVLPDLHSPQEIGELQRVAQLFNPDDPESIIQRFYERSANINIQPLDEELLNKLDNTDAGDVEKGDFDTVDRKLAEITANDPLSQRDWKDLMTKIIGGAEMDMPVIVKYGDIFHLMSGNTRLMISRALGKVPEVAIIDISESPSTNQLEGRTINH